MVTKTNKKRSHKQSKQKTVRRKTYEKVFESDGEYLLKLVLVILLGTFWIKFATPIIWFGATISALPVGLLLGLLLISKFEKFQSDRKIWFAVLIVVGIISYFEPAGIII